MPGMFIMQGLAGLFLNISLGYILCILAKKQEGILRTVGYTFGISIMVISLLFGAVAAKAQYCMMGKAGHMECAFMGKPCPMMMHHNHK